MIHLRSNTQSSFFEQAGGELEWPSPPSFVLPQPQQLPRRSTNQLPQHQHLSLNSFIKSESEPPPLSSMIRLPQSEQPPPYLGFPAPARLGASALTNRPVDYPALYNTPHQDCQASQNYQMALPSFPPRLALTTSTIASDTANLTDVSKVTMNRKLVTLTRLMLDMLTRLVPR